MAAIREIADRLDGQPAPVSPSGDDDAPREIIYSWSDTPAQLPAPADSKVA